MHPIHSHPFHQLNLLNLDLSPKSPLAFFPNPSIPHRSHLATPSHCLTPPTQIPKSTQVKRFIRFSRKHASLLGSPTLFFSCLWIQSNSPNQPPQFFPLILHPIEINNAPHDKNLAIVSDHPSESPSYNPLLPHLLPNTPFPPIDTLDLSLDLSPSFAPLLPPNTALLLIPKIIAVPPNSHSLFHDPLSHPNPLQTPLVNALWPQKIPPSPTPPPPPTTHINWAQFYKNFATTHPLDPFQAHIVSSLTPTDTHTISTISGPPGTGKSHTIVSLITSKLALGQRILFLSQKQPALDVILQRLQKIDLHSYALPLHSPQTATHLKTALSHFQYPKKYPPVLIQKLLQSFENLQKTIPPHSNIDHAQAWTLIEHLSPVLNTLLNTPSPQNPSPMPDTISPSLPWQFPSPIPCLPEPPPPVDVPLREILSIPSSLSHVPSSLALCSQHITSLPDNLTHLVEHAPTHTLEKIHTLINSAPNPAHWLQDASFLLQEHIDDCVPLDVPLPSTLCQQWISATLQNPLLPQTLTPLLPQWIHLHKTTLSDNEWIANTHLSPIESSETPPLHLYSQILNLHDAASILSDSDASPLNVAISTLATFVHNLNAIPLHAFDAFFPPHVPVSYHPKLLQPIASTISWLKQAHAPLPDPALIRYAHLWKKLDPLLTQFQDLCSQQAILEQHFNLDQDEATTQQIILAFHSLHKHNSSTLQKIFKFFKPSWWAHHTLYSKIALNPPRQIHHFSPAQETLLLQLGKFLHNASAFIDNFSHPSLDPINTLFEPSDLPWLVPSLHWLDCAPPFLKSPNTPNTPFNPLLAHLFSNHQNLSSINPLPLQTIHSCLALSTLKPPSCLLACTQNIHVYHATLSQLSLINDLSNSPLSSYPLSHLPLSSLLTALSVFQARNTSSSQIPRLLSSCLPTYLLDSSLLINPSHISPFLSILSNISQACLSHSENSAPLPTDPSLIPLVLNLSLLNPHCPSILPWLQNNYSSPAAPPPHTALQHLLTAHAIALSLPTPNPSNPWTALPLHCLHSITPHLNALHQLAPLSPLLEQQPPPPLESTLSSLSHAHSLLLSNRHHEINHSLSNSIHQALLDNPHFEALLHAIRLYTKPALSDSFSPKKNTPQLPPSPSAFFHLHPSFVQTLKPLIMATPHTLPKLLPHQLYQFDSVIIDEASQLHAAHALPALLRAKQIIIVGDIHQLQPPPIRSDSHHPLSLLQLALNSPHIPHFSLSMHYRSNHPSLIHSSNELCYQNSLHPIPSPFQKHNPLSSLTNQQPQQSEPPQNTAPDQPLKPLGTHVIFSKAQYSDSRNISEAQLVSNIACSLMRLYPSMSLGIIASTEAQASFIENLIDSARASSLPIRNFINAHSSASSPLFVKTIDEVQGDERDIIIFSLTYSPSATGSGLPKNLGHLSSPHATNYLNVALSRASHSTFIVHSIPLHCTPKSPHHQTLLNILNQHSTPKYSQSAHTSPSPIDSSALLAFSHATHPQHPLRLLKLPSDPAAPPPLYPAISSGLTHISCTLLSPPPFKKHTPILLDHVHLHSFHHIAPPLLSKAGWNTPSTPHSLSSLSSLSSLCCSLFYQKILPHTP